MSPAFHQTYLHLLFRRARKIAIVGERDPSERAHRGVESPLARFRRDVDPCLNFAWINTATITAGSVDAMLNDKTGVWCAPGCPYESTAGALLTIRHARVARKTFLGTCGGFQHALLEYAQNVLGREAEHEDMNPAAREPLIMKLSCSLVGATGPVIATDPVRFADLPGGRESVEELHCNYGFNGNLAGIFQGSSLNFVSHDAEGQIRAFRPEHHPFIRRSTRAPGARRFPASAGRSFPACRLNGASP